MTETTDQTDIPIVCDMTDAPDTAAELLAEYQHLYGTALVAPTAHGRGHPIPVPC
jgi:hypothetical protein